MDGTIISPKKSKAPVVAVVIILIVLAGAYLLWQSSRQNQPINQNQNLPITEQPQLNELPTNTAPTNETGNINVNKNNLPENTPTPPVPEETTKTFTIVAKNFSFSLPEIRVKKGDRVKIVLQNQDGFHDWVIDEFNARTQQISAGQTGETEFTADKTGTFEFYCSVNQHRQMGMKGNLIVE